MTDPASLDQPLYRRVYHALHDEIVAEKWPPGTLLPNEPTLAQQFSVSRVTIRRSLAELEPPRSRYDGAQPLAGAAGERRRVGVARRHQVARGAH
ncbi:MAG: GntR family transcriptional regulator [Alphaproteobacteria bacterium]|jgi:DNA-binding transcriptional MocR family regulator|nr:GntR family transcriptional regulator [Alphaproteobacteria bacterium]